jgi:hypothetical protein
MFWGLSRHTADDGTECGKEMSAFKSSFLLLTAPMLIAELFFLL